MSHPGGDRIKELSNSSGTSSFVLTGAVSGESVRTFSSAEDGKHIRYVAKHITALEAESGFGVYTHSTRTLTRLYRYYPTKGGSAVSFSAGGVHVACTPITGDFVPNEATVDPSVTDDVNSGFLMGMEWINTSTPSIWKCLDHSAGAAAWVRTDAVGTPASQAEAETGTDNIKYTTPLRVEQHHAARQAVSSTTFDPANVQVDDDRQYDTYTQSGAVGFIKAGGGTFRRGKFVQVTFDSDGSALTWGADFESLALGAALPATMPAGLHTLVFSWNSHRSKIQVAWASLLVEGAVLKDTSETSPADTGFGGAETVDYVDGQVVAVTLTSNVTSLAISNPPPSGEAGAITFIINHGTGPYTWAHPTGIRWAGGVAPTLSSGASDVDILTYLTRDAGSTWYGFVGGLDFTAP